MRKEVLSSPIRWAGSKKKVLNDMLESFVAEKENYIEPFLGSGVVMINVLNNLESLKYKNIYVNDINKNIIDFYICLKNKPKYLVNALLELSQNYNEKTMLEKETMYYEIRDKFNNNDGDKSIYFYFLMKVGFNGVYRENKKGYFNVPFGKKEKFIIQEAYLYNISKLIKKVRFYNLPYQKFLKKLKKEINLSDSFIYCDPPYIPEDTSVSQKQELYTNKNFEHIKFVKELAEYSECSILISMSESDLAKKTYGDNYYYKSLADIVRTINPQKLFKSKEILFSNYKIIKRNRPRENT